MNKDRKYLHYEIISQNKTHTTFRIIDQSHRGKEFGMDIYYFKSSNSLYLQSVDFPDGNATKTSIFVRGNNVVKDNTCIKILNAKFRKFQLAVQEYNDFFDVKDENLEEPHEIKEITLYETPDFSRFKTRDEAKLHLKMVKREKSLKDFLNKKIKDEISKALILDLFLLNYRELKKIFNED